MISESMRALLLKIYKSILLNIIDQYFLYYMPDVYGLSRWIYEYYIGILSLIFYYDSVFYSMWHDATIVMSCTGVTSDTLVSPE